MDRLVNLDFLPDTASRGVKARRMSRLLRPYFASLIVSLAAHSAQGQSPATPSPAPAQAALPIFRATLPGGTYAVAVRRIVAVSSHEYVVDVAARVYEVNIDTDGMLLARFYYLEPNSPNLPGGLGTAAVQKTQELLTQAADRSGEDAWKKVVKNYPATTHAKTVEYRVQSRADLQKIFAAADEAFRMQKAGSVQIP
jgi:hypothetical protein